MRTPEQNANVQKLLDHYVAVGDVATWGYESCAIGVASQLGIIHSKYSEYDFAEALGLPFDEAQSMIAGPRFLYWINNSAAENGALVVAMLQGVLDGNGVDWGVPKN